MIHLSRWLFLLITCIATSTTALVLKPLGTWNITTDVQGSFRLNGNSFQEDVLVTYGDYQYITFYNTSEKGYGYHYVNVGRRRINPTVSAWQYLTLKDYYQTTLDGHNIISMGISGDGKIHLSFDHHDTILKYRSTGTGVATNPSTTWSASLFGAIQNSLPGSTGPWTPLTYPRFESLSNGDLLMEFRIGASGSGDSYIHKYSQATGLWSATGKYLQGQNNNAYINGLDNVNSRLHVSWCVRETPDANTNHDLFYAYSDDNGSTWKNTNGTSLVIPIVPTPTPAPTSTSSASCACVPSTPSPSPASAKFYDIPQNSQMVNQEGQHADSAGRFHLLMRDALSGTSLYYHYLLTTNATTSNRTWSKRAISIPNLSPPTLYNNRGKLVTDTFAKNLIALLPDDPQLNTKIYISTATGDFRDWTLAATIPNTASEPLFDSVRLRRFGVLSLFVRQGGPYPDRKVQVWDFALQ